MSANWIPSSLDELDGELEQAKVTGLPADLAAKADDAAVVKLAGDQEIAGTKTHTDVIVHDLTTNVSARASRIIPPATAPPIDFLITGFAGGNVPGGSNGYQNGVISIGWNCEGGASKINPDWPTFRIGLECNYWTGSEYWMEGHLFAFTPHNSSGEIRPLSIGVNKSNNYDTFTIFQGSSWVWANAGQSKQRAQLYADVNNNVGFRVVGDDGLEGLYLTCNASPKTDTLAIGRTSSTQTNVTLSSTGFTNLYLVAGANTASITTTTTILAIKAPVAGGFLQERADNYQLLNYAASRFIVRAGDNGTAAQIGFLGAAPVSRQSGDLAAGLVALGLFSSVGKITLPGRDGPVTANTDAATVTFNLATSDKHTLTMNVAGATRTLAISNDTVGQQFTLFLTQDGAGSRTVSWWSGIKWANGTAPTLATAPGAVDVLTFVKLGTGSYVGGLAIPNAS